MRRAAGYRRTESIDGEEERERDRERRFHHSETPPPPPSRRRARSGATAYADDEVVTLNVGGTTFSTLFSTLVSVEGSRLDVLNFLRDRSYPMPVHDAAALARLRAEARYFGLDALAKVIDSATDKCGEVSHGLSDTRASPALSPTRSISGAGAVVANAMGFASPPRVGSGTGGGHTAIDSTTGHKLQSEFIRSVSGSLGDLCERCVSVVVEALTLQAGSGKMEVLLWLRTFEAGSLQGLSSEGVIRGYDLRHNDLKLHEDFAPLLSGSGLALLTHQLRSCGLSFVPTKEVRMVATHSSSGSGSDKYAELPMLRFTLDPAEGIKGSFRSTQAAVLAAAAGVDNLSIVLRSVLSSEEISGVPARSVFTTTRHGR